MMSIANWLMLIVQTGLIVILFINLGRVEDALRRLEDLTFYDDER